MMHEQMHSNRLDHPFSIMNIRGGNSNVQDKWPLEAPHYSTIQLLHTYQAGPESSCHEHLLSHAPSFDKYYL